MSITLLKKQTTATAATGAQQKVLNVRWRELLLGLSKPQTADTRFRTKGGLQTHNKTKRGAVRDDLDQILLATLFQSAYQAQGFTTKR